MIGSPLARTLAWSVHFYTAMGAVAALEAIVFTVRGDVRGAFLWMAAALVIDSSDGTLARAARVKEVVPTYDGSKLDDIVDYLNYVFVPIFFAVETGLLPAGTAGFVAALPLLASAYGFCVSTAKTADFFFTGFPSYWNVVVFYMYAFGASPIANALVLAALSVLVFVPIGYLYPSRQPFLRPLTITLGIAWAVATLVAVFRLPERSPLLLYGSLAFPIYYFALSFYLHFGRRR
ncbi:MAG: CDP-diacylglycerol O-phosphatidyltransferase [Candidatus Binatia bacterium]|jgi:phosphatidylcholine synthase